MRVRYNVSQRKRISLVLGSPFPLPEMRVHAIIFVLSASINIFFAFSIYVGGIFEFQAYLNCLGINEFCLGIIEFFLRVCFTISLYLFSLVQRNTFSPFSFPLSIAEIVCYIQICLGNSNMPEIHLCRRHIYIFIGNP